MRNCLILVVLVAGCDGAGTDKTTEKVLDDDAVARIAALEARADLLEEMVYQLQQRADTCEAQLDQVTSAPGPLHVYDAEGLLLGAYLEGLGRVAIDVPGVDLPVYATSAVAYYTGDDCTGEVRTSDAGMSGLYPVAFIDQTTGTVYAQTSTASDPIQANSRRALDGGDCEEVAEVGAGGYPVEVALELGPLSPGVYVAR